MSGARMGQHADDLDAALPSDGFELGEIGIGHQASASMKPAMASTWTPVTAISGVYTTSSAAHTIVPRASLVTPATLSRLSLIHISEPTRLLSISYAVFCLKKK